MHCTLVEKSIILNGFSFQVAYHSKFEEDKGKYITVTDNPELLRHMKNQEQVSLVP